MRRLNVYYRNLIIVFSVTCLPLAIIALGYYFIGVKQIEEEVNRTHQLLLSQISDSMETQLAHLKSVGNQWAFNPVFNSGLNEGDLRLKPDAARELLASLRIMQETNPLIGNAVFYLYNNDLLVSYEEGINKIKEEADLEAFRRLTDGGPALFWWKRPVSALKYRSNVNVALVHQVQGTLGEPFGAIILYLNKHQIDEMLYPLNLDGTGAAFLVMEYGEWLAAADEIDGADSTLDEAVRREAVGRSLDEGDFVYRRAGTSYSIMIGGELQNGWKVVVATPLSRLTAPVILVTRLVLGISAIGLLAAFILSWLASRSMYRPVKHLVGMFGDHAGGPALDGRKDEFQFIARRWQQLKQESGLLRSDLEQIRRLMKEGFLAKLIQGHLYYLSEDELRQKMAQHGFIAEDPGFVVILIRLGGLAGTQGRFQQGDEQLVTFAAANIASEMTRSRWEEAEVINFHDLSIAVYIAYPSKRLREQMRSDLFRLSSELAGELTSFLHLRATIAVGKLVSRIGEISLSFEETREAMRYGDVDRNAQILDVENLLPKRSAQVSYPFELERDIIRSIRLGMEPEALAQLERFVDKLKKSQGQELLFRQGMLHLLGSILHALMKFGVDVNMLYRGDNLYEQLNALRDPGDMLSWFKSKVVLPYVQELSLTRDKIVEETVEKVITTIRRDYRSPISLESCADEHGVTSYNLSKAFKQYTDVNFIDYLTNVRLEKAKELLRETDMKMNEVAESTGYQPGYFMRVFKKSEGLTPGQYREKHQSK